jgi:hypothetical protein
LKANVTLFWICPSTYQVLEFQNLEQFLEFQELCVNTFIFQVEVISCSVSSSIIELLCAAAGCDQHCADRVMQIESYCQCLKQSGNLSDSEVQDQINIFKLYLDKCVIYHHWLKILEPKLLTFQQQFPAPLLPGWKDGLKHFHEHMWQSHQQHSLKLQRMVEDFS